MSSCPHCGVVLEEKHARSLPQMRRYFSVLRAAFMHWPENHSRQFGDEEEARKWIQMRAGHREVAASIDLGGVSKEQALLIAEASIKAAGAYAVPVLHGETLVIFKPKSIKFSRLSHKDFCKLNDEVDAVIEAETGLKADVLLKETERAA